MGNKKNLKKKTKKNGPNFGTVLSYSENVLLWVALLVNFIGLPLYFKNGYELLATNKYKFFMVSSKFSLFALLFVVVLYYALWGRTKEEMQVYKPIWKIDISMLSFIGICIISYFASSYKKVGEKGDFFFNEGAFYGTSGWYMGLATFLILFAFYFVISRFFIYTEKFWIPVICVATVIFIWGALNRYSVYPVKMEFQSEALISTLGNINWFAGYQSITTPIIMGLFWGVKEVKTKYLLCAPLYISFLMILLNGSDSGVFAFILTMFVLFIVSLKEERRLYNFINVFLVFALSTVTEAILDMCFKEARNYSGLLSDFLVTGIMPVILLVIAIILCIFALLIRNKKVTYPEFIKDKLGKILVITLCIAFVIITLLIFINTKTGGSLPIIGSSSFFVFDGRWGSSRGATWTAGILNFEGMSFVHKLIGSGPDTFYFQLKSNEAASAYAYKFFENSRLTNAHNELITLLVNVGILGTLAFSFVSVLTFMESIKQSKEKPSYVIFALVVVMYLSNNIFSFEQITNTPLYFLVLGIASAAFVSKNRGKGL